MLSVAIPVFNYSVYTLVSEIENQCLKEDFPFEILVQDDGSTLFLEENKRLETLTNLKYEVETTNIGRARIRNKLADKAQFDHILFLDCDLAIENPKFISNFMRFVDYDVVCGNRTYPINVEPAYILHKKYGEIRECRSLKSRISKPYDHFMTNNFMVSKSLIHSLQFDETITGYGHEDTLYGWELEKIKANIKHIDNPVIHIGLDPNSEFISKSLLGVENGWKLCASGKLPIKKIRAIARFEQFKAAGILKVLAKNISIKEKRFLTNLCGNHPNLKYLDLLKLLHLYRINLTDNLLNN